MSFGFGNVARVVCCFALDTWYCFCLSCVGLCSCMIGKEACLGALFQSKGCFGSGHVGLNVHD